MVEALGFTSAATAGLRQDILHFHQRQPYPDTRSYGPKSSAPATLRLSWNGRPVNFTLLLKLLLADAISTLYRLTLDSPGTLLRTNPPGTSRMCDRIGPLDSSTASPHQQLYSEPNISGLHLAMLPDSCPLVSLCQSTLPHIVPGLNVDCYGWEGSEACTSACFTYATDVRLLTCAID